MGRIRRRGTLAGELASALAIALLLSSCSAGSSALSDPHDLPPKRNGPPTDVSVCDLVPLAEAAAALKRPLSVVGLEYGPSRVPTFRCLLGSRFGIPTLTVELASGPIPVPWNVFLDAYGDRAGGDPKPIKRLGAVAYLRNEKDETNLHVFVRGAIVSLRLVRDPARPVPRSDLLDIARVIVERLPRNPRLAGTTPGDHCAEVSDRVVGAVIGVEPSRAVGDTASNGSTTCSWASFPGSVDVTVLHDPDAVTDFRKSLGGAPYVDVSGAGPTVAAFSRMNRPGDLMLFRGDSSVAIISSVPSAGYPDDTAATTPDELALARQVADALM